MDGNLRSVYHFDNTEKLFPIDCRYSFALITFAKAEQVDCVFYASRIEHLDDPHRHVLLSKDDIIKFNPNTKTLVLIRTDKDLEILRKLYDITTVFKREEGKVTKNNLWSFKSSTMFNLSTDSGLFQSSKDGMVDPVPLYEGKMIHNLMIDGQLLRIRKKTTNQETLRLQKSSSPTFVLNLNFGSSMKMC